MIKFINYDGVVFNINYYKYNLKKLKDYEEIKNKNKVNIQIDKKNNNLKLNEYENNYENYIRGWG